MQLVAGEGSIRSWRSARQSPIYSARMQLLAKKQFWENCLWQPNPGVIPDMGHICLPGLCFMPYTGMGAAHGAYSDNLF